MSSPPLSNYGDYYDSASQSQTKNNSYGGSRQQNANSGYAAQNAYSVDVRQNKYFPSGYEWSTGEQQQGYDDNSRQRTGYGSECWTGVNSQSASSSIRAQASNYTTQATAGDTSPNDYNNSRSAKQSKSGLNKLAYASALDDGSSQRDSQRSNAHSALAYISVTSSLGNNRVQPSLDTQNSSRHNKTPSAHGASE
jgi:hypothetical protein